jgi:tRNA-Thr(GGU) m(6)t(6)A37 methyltransferase TsaA
VREIVYRPIGVIHSPFKEPKGVPIQPSERRDIRGEVEVYREYEAGLKDLEGFSHIILLYHMHLSKGFNLEVVPFLDTVKRGLFATRAPRRPNPIGLSVVRLENVQGNLLEVSGLDIVDGTPLLDIKPHAPRPSEIHDVRIGWLTGRRDRWDKTRADDRFVSSDEPER